MSETPDKPKDPVADAVVETWWDMKEQRDRWRSVAEQLAESLDEIRYPVAHMRKRLEPGEQLNGAMAIQLGSDPSYLKEIADKALAAFDSLRKEQIDNNRL